MKFLTVILALTSTLSIQVNAESHEIGQKGKKFSKKVLAVRKGDVVKFTNEDPFFHNVYSMSETKPFDLGSYPKGNSKSVKFDKKGEVEVQCAIHPFMKMTVKVE